jgi:hypothetical protein
MLRNKKEDAVQFYVIDENFKNSKYIPTITNRNIVIIEIVRILMLVEYSFDKAFLKISSTTLYLTRNNLYMFTDSFKKRNLIQSF